MKIIPHEVALDAPTDTTGYGSPAADYLAPPIDLNKFLMPNAPAGYLAEVESEAMTDNGLHIGDRIIINRALTPRNGNIIVCDINGERFLKRFHQRDGKVFLSGRADRFPPMEIREDDTFEIFGVVTWLLCNAL